MPYVAARDSSSSKAQGRFGKQDLDYDAQQNIYHCSAGEELSFVGTGKLKTGLFMHRYLAKVSTDCRVRSQCIKPETALKQQNRRDHEHLVEENAARVDAHPEMMSSRKALAEHLFGPFKHWMTKKDTRNDQDHVKVPW